MINVAEAPVPPKVPAGCPVPANESVVAVWFNPVPRFNIPPAPLKVNAPLDTVPVNVAVPDDFDIVTAPVVVKPSILWVAAVPVIIIAEAPAENVPPLLLKSPPNVSWKLFVFVDKLAPLLIVSRTEALKTLAAFKVIVPVFAIITPPDAAKVANHSAPAVREVAVLYCKLAFVP